ncbi:MAG: Uncharacterised protein [Cellulomonadaceae bacterium TMED98]|nr:MAG: Uncharacterised protein [Cellulomonadaceae bacterium TMED98]
MAGIAGGDEFLGNTKRVVRGNRKTKANTSGTLCRDGIGGNRHIYADELALVIQQRATRVSRVDRGIGLNNGKGHGAVVGGLTKR